MAVFMHCSRLQCMKRILVFSMGVFCLVYADTLGSSTTLFYLSCCTRAPDFSRDENAPTSIKSSKTLYLGTVYYLWEGGDG